MERCEHLEIICEKIRKGEPVGFLEAVAAINYQEQLKAEREAGRWYKRLWRRLRSNVELCGERSESERAPS